MVTADDALIEIPFAILSSGVPDAIAGRRGLPDGLSVPDGLPPRTPARATREPLPSLTVQKRAVHRLLATLLAGAISTDVSGDDLVVSHRPITFDQEAIILGIEDCLINVVARERPDAVWRIPERERDDLRSIAVIATQHPSTLIARR